MQRIATGRGIRQRAKAGPRVGKLGTNIRQDAIQPYPVEVASIRLASAFLVLIPFALRSIRELPIQQLPYILLSGLLSTFVPAYLFCMAQVGLSSSIVGVLNALTPAFTFVFGILLFKQKSKLAQVLGLTTGFVGSALLILINPKGELVLNGYAFYVVAATVCYGLNVNMVKNYLPNVKAVHLTSIAVSVSGVFAFIYLLSTNWLTVLTQNPKGQSSFLAAVTLGVVGTAFAQWVFNYMLRYSTAVFASSITYFIPIVAVMWGVWDGEILSFWHYIGMLCIVGGILILNKF
ncbi:MAG: DMT family transporter [Saprospiraceae bacterium]|nr:DMT family transporter [Saprospiraceae bacterium]